MNAMRDGLSVPVGLSFAQASTLTSAQVSVSPTRNAGGNDSCHAVPHLSRGVARTPEGEAGARGPGRPSGKTGRGVGQARLLALAASLSARDQQVLALLHEHRFLTTPHLYVLLFEEKHANEGTGMRVCRRVLARLHQHRLIDQLPRRVGGYGAGSAAGVWFLTTTGQRLLSLTLGDGAALSAARVRDPSTRFVAHTLAVADTHVRLHKAARARRFGLSRVQTEPDCWRPYLGLHGARETLKPDLAMTTVSGDGQYEDSWFIEVDLGTEHVPTVLGKCAQYEAYRRTGAEQAKRGVFPLVVWMTTASARADKLRGAIRKTSGLDAALFRITTPDGLTDLIARGAA